MKATARYRILRDVLGAILLVLVVLGVASIVTAGTWPPMLVVESGSMMHTNAEAPYGRIGSIDVGDIVFVRAVDQNTRIDLWVEGGDLHYGRPGQVIAYAQDGNRENETIIHRAITWVDVDRAPDGNVTYRVKWLDGKTLTFGDEGIYLPELGFDETWGYTRFAGYRPAYSGYITKGDNPFTNGAADQAVNGGAHISTIVDPSWVEGTVHGEVPWVGLGKLALRPDRTNLAQTGWDRVGNAFAPLELWTMFFLVLVLVILVPFAFDSWRAWREHRRKLKTAKRECAQREAEARARAAERAAAAANAPPPPPPRPKREGPAVFTPISPPPDRR